MTTHIKPGQSFPLGASVQAGGVNFSVYSKNCREMELLLFDAADDPRPARVIALDPQLAHRTFHYWHVFVPGLQSGQMYAYRARGPFAPQDGLCFDGNKVLLDPYGRAVAVPGNYDRTAAARPGDNAATAMKSVVTDVSLYDWEGDMPLYRPFSETIIYEMHVGGFTRHPSSKVPAELRGTYAGLVEKIPYLQELGVTAVELLPVFQFDPQEAMESLTNYWGYNPVSFFAPHSAYSTRPAAMDVLNEFRDMVKALHRAGIEVILDVVFNHTAEGNELGPTFCFKGLENPAYYILGKNRRRYANYSGTGNTLNANHAVVRRLILDSLRYWVEEMHVDGFRFDLASVLSRDGEGHPIANPPILWDIETDPVLSGTKLIAEAWDAAGLYQVGSFFGDHWKEWNGRFRDDVRAFVKSDPGLARKLAWRFFASPDIYGHQQREPEQSINFVTCHDGFTMNDLVSYNEKRNWANKERNRDGHNHNLSWNCGVEGPSDDAEVERLRNRQIKNLLTINLLSLGVPMILMGDEMRHSQLGNNNAYCQNNEISWLDWKLLEKHADIHRFVRHLIKFRLSLPKIESQQQLSLTELLERSRIQWHGVKLGKPDRSPQSRSVAFTVLGDWGWFHIIFSSYWESLVFELPHLGGSGWNRVIDTYRPSPHDFCPPSTAPLVKASAYLVQPRSVVLLIADRDQRLQQIS